MDKKDAAKILFMEGMAQKEIAKMIGTTEQSVTAWKKDGNWEELRTKRFVLEETNAEIIQELINYQLETLKLKVDEWRDSGSGASRTMIGKGEIDALSKMYSAIKKKDVVWADYVRICRELMTFLSGKNQDLSKQLLDFIDEFLNEKRANL
jgi:predicted transcriptional regulator